MALHFGEPMINLNQTQSSSTVPPLPLPSFSFTKPTASPSVVPSQEIATSAPVSKTECVICLQTLSRNNKTFGCDNGHDQYCLDCFVKWADDCGNRGISPRCPVCRIAIIKADLDLARALHQHSNLGQRLNQQLLQRQQARRAQRVAKLTELKQARRNQAITAATERFRTILNNSATAQIDDFNQTVYGNLSQLRGEVALAWLQNSGV